MRVRPGWAAAFAAPGPVAIGTDWLGLRNADHEIGGDRHIHGQILAEAWKHIGARPHAADRTKQRKAAYRAEIAGIGRGSQDRVARRAAWLRPAQPIP